MTGCKVQGPEAVCRSECGWIMALEQQAGMAGEEARACSLWSRFQGCAGWNRMVGQQPAPCFTHRPCVLQIIWLVDPIAKMGAAEAPEEGQGKDTNGRAR